MPFLGSFLCTLSAYPRRPHFKSWIFFSFTDRRTIKSFLMWLWATSRLCKTKSSGRKILASSRTKSSVKIISHLSTQSYSCKRSQHRWVPSSKSTSISTDLSVRKRPSTLHKSSSTAPTIASKRSVISTSKTKRQTSTRFANSSSRCLISLKVTSVTGWSQATKTRSRPSTVMSNGRCAPSISPRSTSSRRPSLTNQAIMTTYWSFQATLARRI